MYLERAHPASGIIVVLVLVTLNSYKREAQSNSMKNEFMQIKKKLLRILCGKSALAEHNKQNKNIDIKYMKLL